MDRCALITGGSSGIGKALAAQFAKAGTGVVLVSDNETKLKAAADEIAAAHPAVRVIRLVKELTRENSAQEVFDTLRDKGVVIHTLVNDAGVGQWGEFASTSIEKDVYILRLNIEALVRLTKIFTAEMLKRGEGKILNVGSIAGFEPGPLLAVYHASKAFVVSFSLALQEELKNSPVTITCLCPGATATHFFERADMTHARIVNSGMVMDAETVAEAGYRALQRGERLCIPGATNKVFTFLRRFMPNGAQAKLNKKFYEPGQKH